MKRIIAILLSGVVTFGALCVCAHAEGFAVDDTIPSAILIEANSGRVLYEKDADLELIPASVTKVMTMLLIMECIDSGTLSYDDMVTASAYAASMGGSQVYLKEGESFTVTDMLKSIALASANDACVAMAEHIAGSEEAFVDMMNKRASELGMAHTNFENTNGLDDTVTSHYTSARDISIMSRELITKHPDILNITSLWLDSVRGGEFGLTNTNRLVRFYKGANGLKTGSTSKAGFCISASALRDGMQLIAVIMKAPTKDIRNEAAKRLFDYGFSQYSYVNYDKAVLDGIKVENGVDDTCNVYYDSFGICVPKARENDLLVETKLPKTIVAPIKKGQCVGKVVCTLDGQTVYEADIKNQTNIKRITYLELLKRMLQSFVSA